MLILIWCFDEMVVFAISQTLFSDWLWPYCVSWNAFFYPTSDLEYTDKFWYIILYESKKLGTGCSF